jgi:hypothetical protein
VIAYVLTEGIDAAISAFPGLEQHRAVAERLLKTDEELTSLEQQTREAQARLDAADRELTGLLAAMNHESQLAVAA